MKKRMVKRRIIAVVSVIFLLAACFFAFRGIESTLRPEMKARANEKVVKIINDCVFEALSEQKGELLTCEKDENGVITMMNIDSATVSKLGILSTQKINELLKKLNYESFSVPLGNLTESPYMVGLGPGVTVRCLYNGSIEQGYESVIREAGINQTSYSLYIKYEVKLCCYSGVIKEAVTVKTSVPVYDVVILGNVPDTYAKLNEAADFMNLMP